MTDVKKMKKMSLFFCSFVVLMISVITHAISEDIPLDAGMIIRIIGKAEYAGGKTTDRFKEAQPLMKIRENDRLKISEQSEATILFQANGQKETWKGPAILEITLTGSHLSNDVKEKLIPKIDKLDVQISDRVFSASTLIAQAVKSRSGVGMIRSGSDLELELKKKTDLYEELKQQSSKEDILPDLFLLTTYAEYGKFEKMKMMIEKMEQKWPQNIEIKKWKIQLKK